MSYVYRFKDEVSNVNYVGYTSRTLNDRMKEHFGSHGHLPSSCYKNTALIEYLSFLTNDEGLSAEKKYIQYYKPKYNKVHKYGTSKLIEDDAEWIIHEKLKPIYQTKSEFDIAMENRKIRIATELENKRLKDERNAKLLKIESLLFTLILSFTFIYCIYSYTNWFSNLLNLITNL